MTLGAHIQRAAAPDSGLLCKMRIPAIGIVLGLWMGGSVTEGEVLTYPTILIVGTVGAVAAVYLIRSFARTVFF